MTTYVILKWNKKSFYNTIKNPKVSRGEENRRETRVDGVFLLLNEFFLL